MSEQARHLLLVVNGVMPSPELFAAIGKHAESGSIRCTVVCPQVQTNGGGWTVDERGAREAAQARLDATLAKLGEQGTPAEGELLDPDPFLATTDAVRTYDPDVVLIFAAHSTHLGVLRKDFVENVRDSVTVPVEHIISKTEFEGAN